MDITPILRRELLTATRKPRLWGNRSFFAAILLTAILATVGARYYWDHQAPSHHVMARVARQVFLWFIAAHAWRFSEFFRRRP